MTRLPKPKQWVFSREIVKAYRSGYAPKKHIPATHPFTSDGANAEGDGQ
jgi:hypothetical protein